MFIFNVILSFHVIAGFLALLSFWVPIVVKKGSTLHNRVGWVFTTSMGVVSVTAIYMGIFRIFFDSNIDHSTIAFSWFLLFIGILSASTAWYGIRVLRFKRKADRHLNGFDLFLPFLLIMSGLSISIYGYVIDFPLLTFFSFAWHLFGRFSGLLLAFNT